MVLKKREGKHNVRKRKKEGPKKSKVLLDILVSFQKIGIHFEL